MGFSLKSVVKKVSKTVSNTAKPISSSFKKISQGNIGGAVGDLTQGATRIGLDIATGGNRQLVDGFSGGLLTSVEGAARGNSKDLIRTGAVGAATFYGGPMAGFAVNKSLIGGQRNFIKTGSAYLTSSQGADMNFSDLLNPQNPLGNLATSYLTGLANNGSKPKPVKVIPQPAAVSAQLSAGPSIDLTKWGLIGGGVLAAIAILAIILKRK